VIPGSKPKIEPTAKVRIGEKRVSQRGSEYPAAVDYFLCEDAQFAHVAGDKPRKLRIRFVHPAIEDAFSTGLEWWIKDKNKRPLLACYTKDGGSSPVALRMDKMLDAGQEPVGPARGNGRLPIACAARECPHFVKKVCKPMGRLVFVLDGGSHVYQIDTKAWNSIERIEGELRLAQGRGPLDAPGRIFELSVEMHTKGADRFPVMSISEVDVELKTEQDEQKADTLLALDAAIAAGDEQVVRSELARALDEFRPGWRDKPEFIARIQEVGVVAAAQGLIKSQMGGPSSSERAA
jgi:hypothetical protein